MATARIRNWAAREKGKMRVTSLQNPNRRWRGSKQRQCLSCRHDPRDQNKGANIMSMSDIEMLGWATFAVYTVVRILPMTYRATLACRAMRGLRQIKHQR